MNQFKVISHLLKYDGSLFLKQLAISICFALLPFVVHAQANGITISVSNVSLKTLFVEIEKISEIRFTYIDQEIDNAKNISITANNLPIETILKKALANKQLEFKRTGNTIAIKKIVNNTIGDKKTALSGVVLDNKGIPIIGANIMEKGTGNGTITDMDGKFKLTVADNATINVSYVGYIAQNLSTVGQQFIKVSLDENNQNLNEVVVVGYGIQKKKLVTGATVQVKGADLQKMNTVSPVSALQSQSPGVNIVKSSGQPGADFKINIRGIGTTGDAAPLFIVDGVTMGSIDYLSPSDIESIDVLKDAASAAIYGARAANGVILVTTKQGKAGKAMIDYDGYVGVQNMWTKVRPLNAQEYTMIMNEAAQNAGTPPFSYSTLVPNWTSIADGSWQGTNWLDEMTNKNALMQNHSLSARGGTEQSVYSLGLSFTDQKGVFGKPAVPTFTRYTALVNSEHKLIQRGKLTVLKMGENFNYINTKRNTIGTGNLYSNDLRSALSTNPFMPVYDANGNFHRALSWDDKQVNPMGNLYYNRMNNITQRHQVSGNAYIEIQPIKNLKYRSSFGINLLGSSFRRFVPVYDLGPQDFTLENRVAQQMTITNKWLFENTLSYDFDVKAHHFNVLLGTSAEKNGIGESVGGENSNMIFNDFEHAYLSNAKIVDPSKTTVYGEPAIAGRLQSYFGRVNYNLKETYMATVVLRADGSSNFAPSHRWGYFPSVSMGWVISNEKFMHNSSSFMDFLKFRVSWGQNGNQNILGFQYLSNIAFDSKYFFGPDKGSSYTGAYPSILANPDVKWETSEQKNIGIDARFFKSRLNLNVDGYIKETKDWLLTAPVLGSYGAGAPFVNGGDVRNRGVELGLSWNDAIGDFKYGISTNVAYNQNKVMRIANTEGIIHGPVNILSQGAAELYRAQVGFPIGYFWGFETNGIFQNTAEVQAYKSSNGTLILPNAVPGDLKFVDKNDDGVIDDFDKTMIGDPNPDYTFGLTLNCAYKGLDLSVVANGVAGNQIIRAYRSAGLPLNNYTSEILGRWTGEGTSNKLPRVTTKAHINDSYISDRYIENGDYLRISNITIGYDFKRLLSKMRLQQARLYVSGQNLFTFTKYKGFDPEVGYGYESSWASGIDLGTYPSAQVFMVGLSIKY